jgi:hypothetical protein
VLVQDGEAGWKYIPMVTPCIITTHLLCLFHLAFAAVYQAPRTWQAVDAPLPPNSPEALLVRAMLIRAAYGGMEGDKEMLLRFSGLWLARFSGTAQPPPELPQQQQQQGNAKPARQQQQLQDIQQQQKGSPQQQQQQQQVAADRSLPGRKGPASFEGAAAAGSPWLAFLRTAYQVRFRGSAVTLYCIIFLQNILWLLSPKLAIPQDSLPGESGHCCNSMLQIVVVIACCRDISYQPTVAAGSAWLAFLRTAYQVTGAGGLHC